MWAVGPREEGGGDRGEVAVGAGRERQDLPAVAGSGDGFAHARRRTARDAWLEKQRGFRPVTPALAAASDVEVCSRWAEEHFQREGVASHPPWHNCSAVATDPSGTRMLLRFNVRYAYWGYNQLLVAVLEAGTWRLRMVVDGEHYHSLSSGR